MLYAGQALVHSLTSAVQELTASEGANMGQLSRRVVRLGNAMTRQEASVKGVAISAGGRGKKRLYQKHRSRAES